jgi:hypothetical protein
MELLALYLAGVEVELQRLLDSLLLIFKTLMHQEQLYQQN